MCTVTYIPSGSNIILTASRDEQKDRPAARIPDIYRLNNMELLFPKDELAGGTWFAINENGAVVVLLNGALKNHTPRHSYRRSRGLVLLDLTATRSPVSAFDQTDLKDIAPFTLIVSEKENLRVCRWDGAVKTVNKKNAKIPHIWSSATLYDPEAIAKREKWFADWLSLHPEPSAEDMLRFHRDAGDGNPHHDLLMNRNNKLFTQSISIAHISANQARFQYLDLLSMEASSGSINFLKAIPVGG
jgi:hypothetical protein